MAHLVDELSKYFSFELENIDIDNMTFKMYYKVTALIFFGGSLVGVMSQYFGDPINCDFKGVDPELASDYCWIHGSSYIPPEYQLLMKCIIDHTHISSRKDAPVTSYYQWVAFVLLFQAGSFLLPYKMWQSMEGGLLEAFGSESHSIILLNEDEAQFQDDAIIMNALVAKYVKFFTKLLHHNNIYFAKFILCELLNFAFLALNFFVNDKFLSGRFWYYGWETVMFYQLNEEQRRQLPNPLCAAFPTDVSCTVPGVGAAGGPQYHNGLCVLSQVIVPLSRKVNAFIITLVNSMQNIINEKIYLLIWFWFVILAIISVLHIFYRIGTIFFHSVRYYQISRRFRYKTDPEIRRQTRYVLSHCYLGDWFVLCQLSKNINVTFFREFMRELRLELRIQKRKKKHSDELPEESDDIEAGLLMMTETSEANTDSVRQNRPTDRLLKMPLQMAGQRMMMGLRPNAMGAVAMSRKKMGGRPGRMGKAKGKGKGKGKGIKRKGMMMR